MFNSHPSLPSFLPPSLPSLPSHPPSLPPLPPSLHLVTQQIHCPFHPKQSPSLIISCHHTTRLIPVQSVICVSPAYNLLLSVRQRRLRYLGHLLRLPLDSVVRRTRIAMAGGGNRYPEGSLFMDSQGSELKDLETLAVNRTAWRSKVATRVV